VHHLSFSSAEVNVRLGIADACEVVTDTLQLWGHANVYTAINVRQYTSIFLNCFRLE
jgi:hypothetical protein